MAIRNGMIFASLDPNAPHTSTSWLGDFAFYLDFYTGQSDAGMEFRGPQRWRIEANWKIGAENFMGDSYHTPHTHASVVDIRLFGEPKPNKRKEGVLWQAGPGGGTTYKLPPGSDFRSGLRYVGYPDEMIERMANRWSAEPAGLAGESGFMPSAATLFPNLSFVHNWPQVDADGRIVAVHLGPPVAADRTGRDRGLLLVLRCRRRPRRLQGGLVQGLPDVLRFIGDVRAGRRGELGLDHHHGQGLAGQAAAVEQPDGPEPRPASRSPSRSRLRRPRGGLPGLRRVQPAPLVLDVGRHTWSASRSDRRPRSPSAWGSGDERHGPPGRLRAGPLGYGDERHQQAAQFLVEEAHLLDTRDFDRLARAAPPGDPVPHAGAGDHGQGHGYEADVQTMHHFDEDWYSLSKRVARFGTDTAWTEDPPSRTRHIVTNVRTHPGVCDDEISVRSSLLLFRSRGDDRPADYVCADRADDLVETAGGLKLRRRVLSVEESVLRTQNLAIFL